MVFYPEYSHYIIAKDAWIWKFWYETNSKNQNNNLMTDNLFSLEAEHLSDCSF